MKHGLAGGHANGERIDDDKLRRPFDQETGAIDKQQLHRSRQEDMCAGGDSFVQREWKLARSQPIRSEIATESGKTRALRRFGESRVSAES